MSFLSVHDLCFRYGDKLVLNHFTLDVDEGEFVSLLGPSGCGKTTSLMLIAGFEHPETGTIIVDGEDLTNVPAHRRNMGMVFQNFALFPHMTIIENVAYGLRQRKLNKKEAFKEAEEALDLVQLHGMGHRSPNQLSGGQQQRVALARAIVIKPRLLLLDECLSSLDRKLRVEMEVELRKIQREVGITTLFVTHDQEEALTLSDKVALLREGALVQYDRPSVIYEQPKDAFVAGFLGKANFIEGIVKSSNNGKQVFVLEDGNSLEFETINPLTIGSKYTIGVRPEKIAISAEQSNHTSIQGIISLVTYAGGITHYSIQALGKEWIIQSQNDSVHGAIYTVGSPIWFGWQAENSLIL
jgi:spermidine/putrescine ABC transporter ATP-binding subunit